MRVLFADDSNGGNAWYYIRTGFLKAMAACGHDCILWDIKKKPAFDAFDELEPELFIGQSYNLDRGTINSILERPNLKVVLKGADWSKYSDEIDVNKYPILRASEKDIKLVEKLNQEHPIEFLFGHYHSNRVGNTHTYWNTKLGLRLQSLTLGTDISDYIKGEVRDELKSDICLVSGYWPYKGQVIDKWFFPLCDLSLNLNIKIFGNRPFPVPQYCGYLDTPLVKHALKSSKLCVNLGEPHYTLDYCGDLNERTFKLASLKCPIVQDYSATIAEDFFPDGEIELAKTPAEFKEKCLAVINGDLVIDTQKAYDRVMKEHTYFHRVSQLFEYLGMKEESDRVLQVYQNIRGEYSI